MRRLALLVFAACTTRSSIEAPRSTPAVVSPAPAPPAPTPAPTPTEQLEAVLRAHLRDPDMKTCLTASSAREHVIRIHPQTYEGTTFLVATNQHDDVNVTNCLNRVIAPLTQGRIPQTGELLFRLIHDPARAELGFEVLHEPPREAPPARVELVAGTLGGGGYRDGAADLARFDLPLGIAVDPSGDLLVADVGSRAIRRVARATGEVSTFASTLERDRTARWDHEASEQPAALAYDPAGRLHLLDALTGEIFLVTPRGLELEYAGKYGTAGYLRKPLAMAFDRDGTAIVVDSSNHRLVRIDLAHKTLVEIAGTHGTAGFRDGARPLFSYPEGLALDDAGHAYVAEWSNHAIREVTLATGATRTIAGGGRAGHVDGVGRAARFDAPSSLVHDRGVLYVAESEGLTIRRVDLATKRVTTLAGAYKRAGAADGVGAQARFDHYADRGVGEVPFGLALVDGALYLTDTGNHTVRRIAIDSGEVTTLAGRAAPGEDLRGLAFGADGELYSTLGSGVVRLRGGAAEPITKAKLDTPVDLAVASDGALVVAELAGRVRRVDPRTGAVTTVADADRLIRTVAIDPRGAIVVGGYGSLVEVAPGARPVSIAGASPLGQVSGIAFDGDKVYVLDTDIVRVEQDRVVVVLRELDRAAGTHRTLASWYVPVRGRRWPIPTGLAFARGGLYFAHGNGTIVRFDLATGAQEVIAARAGGAGVILGAQASTNRPRQPAVSPAGELVFIDERAVLRVR